MTVAELTIDAIAAGGDGIGRIPADDGEGNIVVFVPRAAPGDTIRARLEPRRRFARGTLEEILIPSKDRTDPLCPHYGVDRCGGCQIQHLTYAAQLEAKRGIVRDAITRIGRREIALPSIEPSDAQWRYRRKLTLSLRARAERWVIGLHPYDDPVAVFQLADCPITDERVIAVWRQIMNATSLLPRTDELRASVRLLSESGDASVVVEGGNAWPSRRAFFEAVPLAGALWWRQTHRSRQLVAERGGGHSSASASFAQVNVGVGRAVHDYVLGRARSYGPRVVVDAYSGTGATAIPLANDGARVVAIEADRDAAARCAEQLPATGGSRSIAARVEDAIEKALPADVVLVNPPRTGLHERVCSILEATPQAPRAIVYVSCDPATLGRDLTRLSRYRIASLRTFDMFPQTAHVETVCELVPEAAA